MVKFSFSKLEIEKVKLFTQSSPKIFCVSGFNVGGCLASCLIFKPFLTLLMAAWLVIRKKLVNIQDSDFCQNSFLDVGLGFECTSRTYP